MLVAWAGQSLNGEWTAEVYVDGKTSGRLFSFVKEVIFDAIWRSASFAIAGSDRSWDDELIVARIRL